MVSQNQNQPETVRTAKDIAEALGRSPTEKGVGKLAAALAETISADITEQEACEILAALPGAYWVQAQCTVQYLTNYTGAIKSYQFTACCHGKNSTPKASSGDCDTMRGAVDKVVVLWTKEKRRETIAARIEREMAEADAAEKALAATAPLAFVPDGSGADSLPIVSTVLSDPARMQEIRDIERIDEADYQRENGERFDTSAD